MQPLCVGCNPYGWDATLVVAEIELHPYRGQVWRGILYTCWDITLMIWDATLVIWDATLVIWDATLVSWDATLVSGMQLLCVGCNSCDWDATLVSGMLLLSWR